MENRRTGEPEKPGEQNAGRKFTYLLRGFAQWRNAKPFETAT
jgi:hypothetical protein